MRILRLIFDRARPMKGSSILPIRGYRFIFNTMNDLMTDCRIRLAVRTAKEHAGGETDPSGWGGVTSETIKRKMSFRISNL